MDYRQYFSNGFNTDQMGVVTGSAAIVQFPNAPAMLLRLKAYASNVGSFFIGFTEHTGTSLPFELDSGDDTGWFKVMGDNLNSFYHQNLSGTSDYLSYWIQK